MRYRMRSVVVDAEPAFDLIHNASNDWMALPEWVRQAYDQGMLIFLAKDIGIWVRTKIGDVVAEPQDWLIRGPQGQVYACKADLFLALYERAPK